MKRICGVMWFLIVLGVAAGTQTQAADKPILALDAGGHTAMVQKVLFSRDGKELVSVSADKTIRVWDVATGEPLRVLRTPVGDGNEGMLYAAALSPNGEWLAVGGFGPASDQWGTIYLISLPHRQVARVLKGHNSVIHDVAFSADGQRLISGSHDNTARVWSVTDGQCEFVLRGHTGDIHGVAFAPDGRRCATASSDDTAAVWNVGPSLRNGQAASRSDAATISPATVLRGHRDDVRCVAWRPDGSVLATGSYDHSIRLWSPEGKAYKGFDQLGERTILSVTFTSDSRRLLYTAIAEQEKSTHLAGLLDPSTGRTVVEFDQHTNTVWHGVLSRDGKRAATCDHVGEIVVWQTADGRVVQKLGGLGRVPWSAAWNQDGNGIAWGNTTNGPDTISAKQPLERVFQISNLEISNSSPASFLRASTERSGTRLQSSGRTTVDVLRSGQKQTTLQFTTDYDRKSNEVRCFTLLHGDRAAVGTSVGLYLFDTHTGQRLRRFQGDTGEVWAVSASPDGRYLLSAGGDMTLRIWDPDRDLPLLSLFFAGNDWIAWTPEGYYAASPGGEKLMGWHVNNGPDQLASFYPASQFRSTFYRPDVIKLLLKTGSVERALELADQTRGRMTQKTEVANVLPPQVTITSVGRAGDVSPPSPAGSGERKTLGGLTSPARQNAVHVQTSEVEVRAVATSRGNHPVTALRLLIDGRPHEGQAGVKKISAPQLGDATASWNVSLSPGKHRLQVLADSSVSQGASDEVEVTYVGDNSLDAVELPTLYVFAVGISAYSGDLKLDYAAKDAEALVAAFQSKSKPLFRKIEVKTLTDKQATRAEILKGLGWLRKEVTQRDYAVFSFSGHGRKDADGGLYFLPVDVDADNLSSTAILADQFKLPLTALPGKVMMLLDACHSGGVDAGSTGRRKGAGELTEDLVRDLVTDESGVVMMCSSTGRESSLENNEARQGNFTLAIVEGLSGKADYNRDGHVYLNELDTYVTDRVKELTRGQQHPVTAKPSSIRSFPLAKP